MGSISCRFCGKEVGVNSHLCEAKAEAIANMKKYDLTDKDIENYY